MVLKVCKAQELGEEPQINQHRKDCYTLGK